MPRRSARNLICSALSSPETYKTVPPVAANCCDTCKSNVDLPIPGSPPIKTNEPGTTPPPKTRFSSTNSVFTRGSFLGMTSDSRCGCVFLPVKLTLARRSEVS